MPMKEGSKTRFGVLAVSLFFRIVVGPLLLLGLGSSAGVLWAQTVDIQLLNGRNGRPMAGACVNVWVGKQRKEAMAIPTNENGVARLRLTDNDKEIDTNNHWNGCGDFGVISPVVKYNDSLRINAGYVLCQSRSPDQSWFAITDFPMKEVLQHGIATANTCGKATASPEPGEVILFVRPLSWWEKLKQ